MSFTAPTDDKEVQHAAPEGKKRPVITWRALFLGTVLIPLNCYWMAVMEIQWNSVDATCVSLFFHVVFLVFVLCIVNAWVARRFPRLAMTPAEILVIYIMLSVASAIAGRDTMQNLLPTLTHPFWFADPTNGFARFYQFIPRWLAPRDPAALRGYFLGDASFYDWHVLKVWLPVIGAWAAFILAMLFVMLCINVIVRRQWMDREKLTFPTIFLPVQMAQDPNFFRSKALRFGFALPLAIQTLNGLNYLYPSIPSLSLKLQDMSQYLVNPPWSGMGWTPIAFYPFAIGMAFFLPLDLSFSCWFFYIVRKLEAVAGVAMGYTSPGGWVGASWPFCREQGSGAWIALCLLMIVGGRKQLAEIFRAALRGEKDKSGELMSYRTALLGLTGGFVAMLIFCVKAGMPPWLPPIYLALFFLLAVGVTRIRAELGPPAHELNWVNPEAIIVSVLGSSVMGTGALTGLTYMFWFNRGYRSLPMPHQLEGMKIGREARMESRRLLAALIIASIVAVFAAFWALLVVFYHNGQATARIQSYTTGIGVEAFNRLNDWTRNPHPSDHIAISWMSLGLGFTSFLWFMKSKFVWWPFHPAGFALANSYALEYWWTTLLIGWTLKFLIVRYGGAKGHRAALPFFAGLILGDYVAASMWSIIGWVFGISVYRSFIF